MLTLYAQISRIHRSLIAVVVVCCITGCPTGSFLCSAQSQHPGNLSRLLTVLSEKTVQAHIERRLLAEYHVKASGDGGTIALNGYQYSRRRFSVRMGAKEEWAPAIGGSFFLLNKKRMGSVVLACRTVLKERPGTIPLFRRVIVQARVWDVFDSLYQDGVNPANYGRFNTQNWHRELKYLAAVMRFLSPSYAQET